MVEFLSKCCEEIAKTSYADEGTGCFICPKCGKPCDVILTKGSRQNYGSTKTTNQRGATRPGGQNARFDNRRQNHRNGTGRNFHNGKGAGVLPGIPQREGGSQSANNIKN